MKRIEVKRLKEVKKKRRGQEVGVIGVMTKPSAGYLYTYRIGKSVYSDIAKALVYILRTTLGIFVFENIYAGMSVGLVEC